MSFDQTLKTRNIVWSDIGELPQRELPGSQVLPTKVSGLSVFNIESLTETFRSAHRIPRSGFKSYSVTIFRSDNQTLQCFNY